MTTECGDPPSILGATVHAINVTAVEYKCVWGTKIQGYEVVLCEYGKWSQDFPACMINWRTEALSGESNYTSSFHRPEVPTWLLTLWGIFAATVFLSFALCFVLLCVRLCWCCRGKAVAFGGTFRYNQTWISRNIFYCCKCEYKPIPSRKKMMKMMLEERNKKEEDTVSLTIEETEFNKEQIEIEIMQENERKAAEAIVRQNEISAQNEEAMNEMNDSSNPETAVEAEVETEVEASGVE
ncbi:uncharacterized protein LOC110454263 isoform X2 [Mizuhopecten yessoensis]|uniref:Sushi domain-containing protein n=2 Tax=Mizuhopecten yessoensis TaxID=6573 RepID=A0A210R4H5_MIZYE|nr:uncharacterized protein LOC110454263 isoform X2 [Mizuhopecten yessoensis]OWF55855.1 hypothetical protein KP79_PYT11635 [Mizuhopecten yessoensis]